MQVLPRVNLDVDLFVDSDCEGGNCIHGGHLCLVLLLVNYLLPVLLEHLFVSNAGAGLQIESLPH